MLLLGHALHMGCPPHAGGEAAPRMEVTTKQYAGWVLPLLSLGACEPVRVHSVPRCPQVAGLQITRATSLLPGYGSSSAGGKPTGLSPLKASPQGTPQHPAPKL